MFLYCIFRKFWGKCGIGIVRGDILEILWTAGRLPRAENVPMPQKLWTATWQSQGVMRPGRVVYVTCALKKCPTKIAFSSETMFCASSYPGQPRYSLKKGSWLFLKVVEFFVQSYCRNQWSCATVGPKWLNPAFSGRAPLPQKQKGRILRVWGNHAAGGYLGHLIG